MNSLISSLNYIEDYFKGDSSSDLKQHMEYYDDHLAALNNDFHKTTILANREVKQCIEGILKSLNIPKSEWREDFEQYNPTIYQFLLTLAQKGFSQADHIIDLIDEKTRLKKSTLSLIGGGILFTVICTLIGTSTLYILLDFLQYFFSSILTVPILGLFFGLVASLYNFHATYNDQKISVANRFRDAFFLFLATLGKVVASLMLLMSGGVMSPIIAGIFVAGAGVEVVKEIFCLVEEFMQLSLPTLNGDDPLNLHRAIARRKFGYEKRTEAIRINLAAALMIVAIMSLWCFIPGGGIVVAIAAISAIGLVYVTKDAWLKYSESTLRDHLQMQLSQLAQDYEENTEDSHSSLEFSSFVVSDEDDMVLDNYDQQDSFELESTNDVKRRSSTFDPKMPKTPSANDLPFFAVNRSSTPPPSIPPPENDWNGVRPTTRT